jgi:hypothetical protein
MIEFTVSFIEFALATLVPIYVGILSMIVIYSEIHLGTRYLSAYAFGLLLWFFFDTLNDAVQLGVNEGYSFDYRQTSLVLLFIAGFLFLTLFSGPITTMENGASPVLLGVLVAFGIGIHGFGEGLGFGGLAAGTPATSVLEAIGGVGGGISYFLHKLLESTIVSVVFLNAAKFRSLSTRKQVSQMAIVGLIFGMPSLIGEAVAYYIPVDTSYFFAMGAGAALSVSLHVMKPIFLGSGAENTTYSQWVGISLSLLLGFFLLYGAALFHS